MVANLKKSNNILNIIYSILEEFAIRINRIFKVQCPITMNLNNQIWSSLISLTYMSRGKTLLTIQVLFKLLTGMGQ